MSDVGGCDMRTSALCFAVLLLSGCTHTSRLPIAERAANRCQTQGYRAVDYQSALAAFKAHVDDPVVYRNMQAAIAWSRCVAVAKEDIQAGDTGRPAIWITPVQNVPAAPVVPDFTSASTPVAIPPLPPSEPTPNALETFAPYYLPKPQPMPRYIPVSPGDPLNAGLNSFGYPTR